MTSLWASAVKPKCSGLSMMEAKICWSWENVSPWVFQKELLKLFRTFPICFKYLPQMMNSPIPWSDLKHSTQVSSNSGLLPPSEPRAKRAVTTPGNPLGLESQAWKQLTGMKLSGHEWVWSDHSRAFGNNAGINLAPWLCSVESTAGIYKQTITHWMLSYGSRAKSPGHAKGTVTTPKGRRTTFTVCFSPSIIFNHQKSFTV